MKPELDTEDREFLAAIYKAKKLQTVGIEPLVGLVASRSKKISEAYKAVTDYIYLMQLMKELRVKGSVAIRLMHLGLERAQSECFENLKTIIREAKNSNIFLWLETDSAEFTKQALQIYLLGMREYKKMGVIVKANLKRSEDDIKKLLTKKSVICLMKGIYQEDEDLAYQEKKEIDDNYSHLMKILFEKSDHFAIATHDKKMIKKAIQMNKKHNKDIEFQFFAGMGSWKKKLRKEGYKVGEYTHLGKEWFPSFWQRVTGRKNHI